MPIKINASVMQDADYDKILAFSPSDRGKCAVGAGGILLGDCVEWRQSNWQ